MEKDLENKSEVTENEQIAESDIIGNNISTRATQTLGGDNLFILELRDKEIEEKSKLILEMEKNLAELERKESVMKEIIQPHLEEGTNLYYDYMFSVEQNLTPEAPLAGDPNSWSVELFIWAGFMNKNQEEGDTLPGFDIYAIKKYENIQDILVLIPKNHMNSINKFLAVHNILPSSVFNSSLECYNWSDQMKETCLIGPYFDNSSEDIVLNQKLSGEAKLVIYISVGNYFSIIFYSSADVQLYHLEATHYTVSLVDCQTKTFIHNYVVDSEGELIQKTD